MTEWWENEAKVLLSIAAVQFVKDGSCSDKERIWVSTQWWNKIEVHRDQNRKRIMVKCICKEDLEDFESNSEHGMHEALFFATWGSDIRFISNWFPIWFFAIQILCEKLNVNVKKDKLVQFNQTVFHSTSTWWTIANLLKCNQPNATVDYAICLC